MQKNSCIHFHRSKSNRPQTAVLVRATVLNTEKLNQLGLDMTLTRKEYLKNNVKDFILPPNRIRDTFTKHWIHIRKKATVVPVKTEFSRCRSMTKKVLEPIPHSPMKSNDLVHPRKTLEHTKGLSHVVPVPCQSCQRSNLPEKFHSHHHSPQLNLNKKLELEKVHPKHSDRKQKLNVIKKSADVKEDSGIGSQSSADEFSTKSTKKWTFHSKKMDQNRLRSVTNQVNPSHPTDSSKNRFLICSICGKMYGTTSLKIHEPQCLQKWQRDNEPLKAVPSTATRPESSSSIDDWNLYVYDVFKKNLVHCPKCGRTFFPDRLLIHEKVCKTSSPSKENSEKVGFPFLEEEVDGHRVSTRKRPTVTCYICGREFGTRSIAIHEPQCLQKWHWQNDKLPEHLRRQLPCKSKTI